MNFYFFGENFPQQKICTEKIRVQILMKILLVKKHSMKVSGTKASTTYSGLH